MIFASTSKAFQMLAPEEGDPGAPVAKIYAKQLVQQYKNLHHTHLQTHGEIGYNTVYVSLSMLELIQALENMYNGGEGSDICRVYFGSHDGEEVIDGVDVSNKMTLIFVGAKTVGDCIIEQIDNTTKLGYDFGSLCPPECNYCSCEETSLAREVFGETPCNM